MTSSVLSLGRMALPKAPALRKLLGPSFIILGLGLGSGEVVLWPYMASNYGLGIVWGILVGITMQFFINMEVERYALVNGESVFVGFVRLWRWFPVWFITSTFLGFGWPGIGLYGATLFGHVLGGVDPRILGVGIFLAIGAVLTLGSVLYKTVETLQKCLIGIGVPFIAVLTYSLADVSDLVTLAKGLVGIGSIEGVSYFFLPEGLVFGTFLGALAYAGAGGNLNLAQSCYVRDKGYGMGAYADKITGMVSGKEQRSFSLTGNTFEITTENIREFRKWWVVVNREHALVFWLLGLFTMLTLSLLAYITTFGLAGNASGITFVVNEAAAIGRETLSIVGSIFLIVTGTMLCATQLTVLDSTSRIITENVLLLAPGTAHNVSRSYYIVLWLQILFGITVFLVGFDQPLTLIVLGAILNAFSMFVYTGILLWMNNRLLAAELRPSLWRNLVMLFTFLFFGVFCVITAAEKLL
jgi:hypothetical protein